MSLELSKEVVVSVASNAVAAGVTAVSSNVVDMAGFDAVAFVAKLNTVVDASILTLQAFENAANSNSGGWRHANHQRIRRPIHGLD